ncbi:hypothetical protein ACS0TY_022906 [Phlomoides rotata]
MGSSSPSPISTIFVYGSLLADDVVRVLLGRVPPSSPAILPHFQRFSIKGRVYPAIVPGEDKKVTGKVLLGITPPELHILDEFEDVEYERASVNVFLKDGTEKLEAYTYVWENKTDPDLYGEWDFEVSLHFIAKKYFVSIIVCSSFLLSFSIERLEKNIIS